jgi:hypothetical protein
VLAWTGDRVPDPKHWPEGARLPREERMRLRENRASLARERGREICPRCGAGVCRDHRRR